MDAVLLGTMGTTEKDTIHLHAVTNDSTSTMRARRCQGMDGAFEAIEYMGLAVLAHFKTLVICVAAYLTFGELASSSSELIFFSFHYTPLSSLLLVPGGLRFLDVLPPRLRLRGCRLGALGDIPPRLGFKAVAAHMDRP